MDRRIKAVKKDRNGNVVAFCNPDESWSPRRTTDVARDISKNQRSYYVQEQGRRVYVRVLAGGRLQTTKDAESGNHLSKLPPC
jgi:hypothetical protein